MTWTVRIYNDETLSSHTDYTAPNEVAAYAIVYNEPSPLPPQPTLKTPGTNWFDIYNDAGICIYGMPTDANHGKTLS